MLVCNQVIGPKTDKMTFVNVSKCILQMAVSFLVSRLSWNQSALFCTEYWDISANFPRFVKFRRKINWFFFIWDKTGNNTERLCTFTNIERSVFEVVFERKPMNLPCNSFLVWYVVEGKATLFLPAGSHCQAAGKSHLKVIPMKQVYHIKL